MLVNRCVRLFKNCKKLDTSSIMTNHVHQLRDTVEVENPRILITGGLGQLGAECAKSLREKYGNENVIITDIRKPTDYANRTGPYEFADVLDFRNLQRLIVAYNIDWIIHFSILLSAVGEQNVPLAMRVNIEGVHNVMELARQYKLKLFIPSTIGAFGPDSPRNPTPNVTIQRPRTIYGVSKVYAELLGEYYFHRFGLDFRSLRFPGVISCDTPGGGTTDYAISIFHDTISKGSYECYLKPNTMLPMIYIEDCIKAFLKFLTVPNELLKRRVYNIAGLSFTPKELAAEIRKSFCGFKITYKPDERQQIADTWPQILDDSEARKDWQWNPRYNLEQLVEVMIHKTKQCCNEKYNMGYLVKSN